MNTVLGVLGCGLLVGGAIIYFVRRSRKSKEAPIEIGGIERKSVEGTLSMKEVVGWFRTRPELNKDKDVPFVAKLKKQEVQVNGLSLLIKETLTPNKLGVLFGVYNEEANIIKYSVIVEADRLDEEVEKLFLESDLVVLS